MKRKVDPAFKTSINSKGLYLLKMEQDGLKKRYLWLMRYNYNTDT